MARVEWIKHRLDNWGGWKVREVSKGLGYARSSVFMALPSSGSRESVIPVDEVDAALTDQAVESLRGPRPHLHRVLYLVYVDGMGIRQAAVAMARAESTVKANLEAADHALAVWFRARDEAARAQRERVAALAGGSFTS